MKKDKIAGFLNIEPLEAQSASKQMVEINPPTREKDDYEYARTNLYGVIEKGTNALEDILDIAKQSESARAFEVATNLIKTMVDANKDLLQLAKTKKEIEKVNEPVEQTQKVTNNNLFVGSSTDLLKMIKGEGSN